MTDSLLSVQLYTVREALREDLPGTLARLAELGLTQVEAFNIMGLEGLAEGLTAAGLTTPTAHQRFVAEEQEPIFEKAASLGVRTLIDPHIADERWKTADGVKGIVDDLTAAAERAKAFGLSIGYHNHAFEFTTKIDGRFAYDYFAPALPDGIGLEVDAYWAAVGGADAVALVGELGSKVIALHVKDGPLSLNTKEQVAVGKGSAPVREIIEAAPHALRVIELDDSHEDRFQAVADSVGFLTKEGLA